MIGWLIGIGILLIALLIAGIFGMMYLFNRLASTVTAIVVSDTGESSKIKFKKAPDSFVHAKKRYIYDERAVFRFGGSKYLLYRETIPEPISVHLFKNPRVLSSSEFETVIRAEVHRQLFGASAISTIKMIAYIILGVSIISLLLMLFIAFTSSGSDPVVLSGDNVTRQIITDSVRSAIGR